jgi:hypothetical protein
VNEAFESEESSGVTSMAPVPAKPLRLNDVDEKDRTAYFSVTALVERGKAVAARVEAERAVEPPPPPPAPEPPTATAAPSASLLQQLGEASLARKATLIVLALLLPVAAMTPVFDEEPAAKAPAPAHTPPLERHAAEPAPSPSTAAPLEPLPALPKGVTLERAATDALAGGDFGRARRLYEELARQKPGVPAYREAARVLERRLRERQQP